MGWAFLCGGAAIAAWSVFVKTTEVAVIAAALRIEVVSWEADLEVLMARVGRCFHRWETRLNVRALVDGCWRICRGGTAGRSLSMRGIAGLVGCSICSQRRVGSERRAGRDPGICDRTPFLAQSRDMSVVVPVASGLLVTVALPLSLHESESRRCRSTSTSMLTRRADCSHVITSCFGGSWSPRVR